MKVTLGTSTGARIDVRQEQDIFHARRADQLGEPQTCLGVDLFEVIAELAQLDLDHAAQAAEAIRLAERAMASSAAIAANAAAKIPNQRP